MVFASKVRKIYPHLRSVLLAAGFLWCLTGSKSDNTREIILYLLLGYATLLVVFNWLHKRQYFSTDNQYFVGLFFDAAIIAALVKLTGGLNSEFYLAFFPVVALASVFCDRWRAILGALWYGLCYLVAVNDGFLWENNLKTASLRLLSIWSVGLVTYSVAHFMRSSEKKLLKTLNILNERTWELETSQVQISNIYETSRALSGILDLEHLLGEILRVADRIFRFRKCRIFLSNAIGDQLFLYAALDDGNRHIYEEPIPHKKDIDYLKKIGVQGSAVSRVARSNGEQTAGDVDMPLISRGNVLGVMQVTPEVGKMASSKDKRLLTVFAAAAAVAIDNSLLHKKTEELTIIDALTGLFNYRFFRERLVDELRRADRYRQKLSILMLDLDHFKGVNDRFGHQTGNVILKEVSEIISHCVRDIDVVARYGGEEFVVILPQTDEEDALVIARRIRDMVEKNSFADSQGYRDIRITISIGVATYPDGVHSLDQLLENVDKALYRAKADGRNLVRVADKAKKRTADIS